MKNPSLLAWHFLPNDRRLTHGDGRLVQVGQKLTLPPPVSMAGGGFHASVRALDALHHAPGAIACRVKMEGQVMSDPTRVVASERTVVGMGNATRALHEFSVWCADQALQLVSTPDPRSVAALERKREWLAGKVVDQELEQAWADAFAAVAEAPDHRLSSACLVATYAAIPVSDTVEQSARDASGEAIMAAIYQAERDGVISSEERERVKARIFEAQSQVLEGLLTDLTSSASTDSSPPEDSGVHSMR